MSSSIAIQSEELPATPNPAQRPRLSIHDWLWLLLLASLSSVWCLSAWNHLGATYDEPGYIQKGLEFWHTGSHAVYLRAGTLPLVMDLDTLPIFLREKFQGHPTAYLTGDDPQALRIARIASLLWWWLLLIYAMRIGNLLAGKFAARSAVALLVFEPTFLANIQLMADIAFCACLLAFLYHYRVGRDRRWIYRVAIPAVWFAVVVLAKLSAIFFATACVGVIEIGLIWQSSSRSDSRPIFVIFRHVLLDYTQIILLGFVLVILYCGSGWTVDPHVVNGVMRLKSHASIRPIYPLLRWIAHLPVFPNAMSAIAWQLKRNSEGRGVYLLGRVWESSVWYYFPLVFTMKLTLPLLLLPLFLALLRPRSLLNWACGSAAVLLLMSLFNKTQIGIRLELPVVALGAVGSAAALANAAKSSPSKWQKRIWTAPPMCILLWAAFSSIRLWPDALVYINEAWGGSERGYLLLSESDYDHGQGLPDLANWQQQHDSPPLDVIYFGRDPAIHRMSVQQIPLRPAPVTLPPTKAGRYLAISTTYLYGANEEVRISPEVAALIQVLRSRQPFARTPTFFIYDEAKIALPPR